ncbi:hypothetical protein ACA910_009638 [Epithemia clementina (nom. ined.)]
MPLSPAQRDLVDRLKTNPDMGLTTDEVTARREESGQFNVVKPPIDCPPTVCCLLPCIKHIPSMKAFRALQPDEAEVLRNGTWIRYDVTSLVVGDIIRMEEGDVVPADCVVLDLTVNVHNRGAPELLVDVRGITAEEKPRSAKRIPRKDPDTNLETLVVQPVQLYWGGTVVQGGCIAVVTAIGSDCFVSTLIATGKFPPPSNILLNLPVNATVLGGGAGVSGTLSGDDNGDDDIGVSLVQAQRQQEPMVRETV